MASHSTLLVGAGVGVVVAVAVGVCVTNHSASSPCQPPHSKNGVDLLKAPHVPHVPCSLHHSKGSVTCQRATQVFNRARPRT